MISWSHFRVQSCDQYFWKARMEGKTWIYIPVSGNEDHWRKQKQPFARPRSTLRLFLVRVGQIVGIDEV